MVQQLLFCACLRAFAALSDEDQRILIAIDVEGESYDAYAQRTGTYRLWMTTLVFRARHRLHAEFLAVLERWLD